MLSEYILIEIVEKRHQTPDSSLLDALVKNFESKYSIKAETLIENGKEKRKVIFTKLKELDERVEHSMFIYNFFIKNYFQDKQSDMFQFWQRILKEREEFSPNEKKNFLIIKYTTNIIPKLRNYYQFLNKFVIMFDTLYYIDEVDDGFLLYFEREKDFQDYLFNLKTPKDLADFTRDKHLKFPEGVYDKLSKLILQNMKQNGELTS